MEAAIAIDPRHKVINEERFDDIHEVLPPIYVSSLDGKPIRGVACSEAYSFANDTVVLTLVWYVGTTFFETLAEVRTPKGENIDDTYEHQWQRKYTAVTHTSKKKVTV